MSMEHLQNTQNKITLLFSEWRKIFVKMKIYFKKLDPRATVPTYGSECAAGADLRAVLDTPIIIKPNESVLIRTGIATAIPEGYVGLVYARSGIACKRGLAPSNKVGVIDAKA